MFLTLCTVSTLMGSKSKSVKTHLTVPGPFQIEYTWAYPIPSIDLRNDLYANIFPANSFSVKLSLYLCLSSSSVSSSLAEITTSVMVAVFKLLINEIGNKDPV